MSRAKTICALIGMAILTAGCTAPNLDALRQTKAGGDGFTRALTREYLQFASFEADQMDDWLDADRFAAKGLKTARGEAVAPERIEDWRVPAVHAPKLARARARLVGVLAGGARKSDPEQAAIAQARFDCWVEQQEEDFQPDDIAYCRNGMFAALASLEQRAEVLALIRATDKKGRVTVLFAHDGITVEGPARRIIRGAAKKLRDFKTWKSLVVSGHADRSGPGPYNKGLSQRRADAVRAALIRAGFPGHRIMVTGLGEEKPAIATADGVREPRNRRAVIAPVQDQAAAR